jgi:hypothetical protein
MNNFTMSREQNQEKNLVLLSAVLTNNYSLTTTHYYGVVGTSGLVALAPVA